MLTVVEFGYYYAILDCYANTQFGCNLGN